MSYTTTTCCPDSNTAIANAVNAICATKPVLSASIWSHKQPDHVFLRSVAQFASWLNLCLQNKITGGKVISSQTGPGSNRAAQTLRWATQSLYRSQSSLAQHFRRMRARLGTPEATTATAHKLARIIYHLITHRVAYDDSIIAAAGALRPAPL